MSDQKTGLVVTAHPGDFVWRAGGAIALHAKNGYKHEDRLHVLRRARRKPVRLEGSRRDARKRQGRPQGRGRARRRPARRRDRILRLRRLSAQAQRSAFRPHGRHLPRTQSGLRAHARARGPVQFRPSERRAFRAGNPRRRAGDGPQAGRASTNIRRRRSICSSRTSPSSATSSPISS